ncbi:MAG: hypothetical protein ABEJ73_09235 [Haloplanus sp.]
MGLSRSELVDLGLLVVGGVVLAVASVTFRTVVSTPLGVDLNLYRLQYSLGFMFLGVLVLLLWQANTRSGKIGLTVITLAVAIGLASPPPFMSLIEAATNVLYTAFIVGGGFLHYQFNSPSNTLVIGLVAAIGTEFYLYGVGFCLLGFAQLGRSFFIVAIVLLTAILFGFRNILASELEKTHDTSVMATWLGRALSADLRTA